MPKPPIKVKRIYRLSLNVAKLKWKVSITIIIQQDAAIVIFLKNFSLETGRSFKSRALIVRKPKKAGINIVQRSFDLERIWTEDKIKSGTIILPNIMIGLKKKSNRPVESISTILFIPRLNLSAASWGGPWDWPVYLITKNTQTIIPNLIRAFLSVFTFLSWSIQKHSIKKMNGRDPCILIGAVI